MEDFFYQEDNFQEEGICKVVNSFNEDVSRFMFYSMKLKYCNREMEKNRQISRGFEFKFFEFLVMCFIN